MYNQQVIFTREECNRIIDMNKGFIQSQLYDSWGGGASLDRTKTFISNKKRSSYDSLTKTTDEVRNLLLPKLSKYGVRAFVKPAKHHRLS
jgi:hypothetical protein